MISLKKADFSDIEFLWYLRNQPDVYKFSKEKRRITWPEHIYWIIPVILGNTEKELFIVRKGLLPVGQIRFDFNDKGKAVVSISLLKEFRSKGIGNESFEKAIKLLKKTKKPKIVLAEIHKDNIPSIKLFEKLNFQFKEKKGVWLKYILEL